MKLWVPHIPLVFRKMWDTTNLRRVTSQNQRDLDEIGRVPHVRTSVRGPKTMGVAQRSLFLIYRALAAASSIVFHSSAESCNFAACIFSSKCFTEEVPGIGIMTAE